jgi:predicted ATP-dependent endonuclease of OLD family
MKLKHVELTKYKSFDTTQSFSIDDNVTILVGKNESGKTAILESIAKTNYFMPDNKFKFNPIFDYPRKEKKQLDKSGLNPVVITCTYEIDEPLLTKITEDLGDGIFKFTRFNFLKRYDNTNEWEGIDVDIASFLSKKLSISNLTNHTLSKDLLSISNLQELTMLRQKIEPKDDFYAFIDTLLPYFKNEMQLSNPLLEYVIRKWLNPNMPKFLYYDEYYNLPSRIDLQELNNNRLPDEEAKTSQALFELADIDVNDLLKSNDFESYISELEATGNEITQQFFKYWSNNKDLRIRFQIDKQQNGQGFKHILDVRVENIKHMITLPLKNRSKGFNWFFSFIVWFSKIQENKNIQHIILLDEPGLNLHASAQADLLRFIETLSEKYQIIYTTHSPFMVESNHLERVRTIMETDTGSQISDSIQGKDSDTLFPLQAALGYDIAQNLFISKNNLIVEGPADLLYLTIASNLLQSLNKIGLNEGITIVPAGGLDKVVTFISLLKATKLNIVCLLDTFNDNKGKQRLDDLIHQKIIRDKNIHFFHEFTAIRSQPADIEDLFSKQEYINLFNQSFDEYPKIKIENLESSNLPITKQISIFLKLERYNHYKPAYKLLQSKDVASFFSEDTISRFERVFICINALFPQ